MPKPHTTANTIGSSQCDENRPVCLLCTVSDRKCSYTYEKQTDAFSLSNKSPQSLSSVAASTPPNSISTPQSPCSSSVTSPGDPALGEGLNLEQMELLIHVSLDRSIFDLGKTAGNYQDNVNLCYKLGLEYPYLLHQLLAFSARHLAYLHPGRSDNYMYKAVTLQTRAVSLFNNSWTEVDKTNCVPILLFSTFLGHHLLADTLSERHPDALESFLAQYLQCVEMHRGIYLIATNAWPLLQESPLQTMLLQSAEVTNRSPVGKHCQQIKELVERSKKLSENEKEACFQAIWFLQIGFDAMLAEEDEQVDELGNRHRMIFSWTMLVPHEYSVLIASKTPEALIIMSYYAVMLHYGRFLWQVGDSGQYVFDLIAKYLGHGWEPWLVYPLQLIQHS